MPIESIYTITPDSDGKPMTLGTKFKSIDDIDRLILNEVTNVPITLKTEVVCFAGDKKKEAGFMERIMSVTENLFKANEHKRNYKKKENKAIKKFKKESLVNPNKTIDLSHNPIELFNELDGFLFNIKSGLDQLAQALNFLLGSGFDSWHKKKNKEGRLLSGVRILDYLENNIPQAQQGAVDNLRQVITLNIDWISSLVALRDNPTHFGGLKNVSHLIFDQRKQQVICQYITHPDGKQEKIRDFIPRTMSDITEFINDVLVSAIGSKAPQLNIVKTKDQFGNEVYSWEIQQ